MNGADFATMPLRFRVWDKELKHFIQYKDIYDSSYDQSKTELEVIDLAHYFYNTDEKIENVIISQDTGLKDKNGKNIYTGDIVFDGLDYLVVQYDCGEVLCRNLVQGIVSGIFCHMQVQGNIWQNPELLEGEE